MSVDSLADSPISLTYFYGIGPQQAIKLHARLLELDLITKNKEYTHQELSEILKNPKIFPELNVTTQADITYNPLRIIPRNFIDIVNKEFRAHSPPDIKFDIVGSYIRGRPTSRDVDLVFSASSHDTQTWPEFFDSVNTSSTHIRILPPFSEGQDKITTFIRLTIDKTYIHYLKMDVFLTTDAEYTFMFLYGIGSGPFNIRMRIMAKKQGLMLNQRGLFKKDGSSIPVKDEREIFDILGMIYRKPSERIN